MGRVYKNKAFKMLLYLYRALSRRIRKPAKLIGVGSGMEKNIVLLYPGIFYLKLHVKIFFCNADRVNPFSVMNIVQSPSRNSSIDQLIN